MKSLGKITIVFSFMLGLSCIQSMAQEIKYDLSSLSGSGTEEFPFLIKEQFDLEYLRQCMEKYDEITKGKYFVLTNDITINKKVFESEFELVSDTASLEKWKPIGKGDSSYDGYAFLGVFEGNNHTIKGIFINDQSGTAQGLFQCIGKGGIVKNLNISDSYINGSSATGSICGYCFGTIENCTNYSFITASGASIQVGGIAGLVRGSDARLLKCDNRGLITSMSVPNEWGDRYNCSIGGICGEASGTFVDSCYNYGCVTAEEWSDVGGVAGVGDYLRWCVNKGTVTSKVVAEIGGVLGENTSRIYKCINEGQVIATTSKSVIGGVVGISNYNSKIWDCVNNADITSDLDGIYAGGITGNGNGSYSYYGSYTPKVYSSINTGNITLSGSGSYAGGIVGDADYTEIYDCTNKGNIQTNAYAAGICPYLEHHSTAVGCVNEGNITGKGNVGGISSYSAVSINGCINKGEIKPVEPGGNVAGILAELNSSSGFVIDCINIGSVNDGKNTGGIAAISDTYTVIGNCYNDGYISSSISSYIGGIAGNSNGTIRNSYNLGTIHPKAENSNVGGIAGSTSWRKMRNCYNTGIILTEEGSGYVGWINGDYNDDYYSENPFNCYYLKGTVLGDKYINADPKGILAEALDIDDFKNLADKLNVVEYYGEELPFIQGLYRPLLKNYYQEDDSLYFKVSTISGDSVYVDLGKPNDNTLFRCDNPSELMQIVYNFIDNGNIMRAVLVDGKSYEYDGNITADNMKYRRVIDKGTNTVCLPFTFDIDDLPEGSNLLQASDISGNGVIKTSMVNTADAGTPHIILFPDNVSDWSVNKKDVEIVSSPKDNDIFHGVFSPRTDWTSNSYITSDTKGIFRLANADDTLIPFRAYFSKEGVSLSELILEETESSIDNHLASKPIVQVSDGCICIANANNKQVSLFSVSGKILRSMRLTDSNVQIPIETPGIYIIQIGNEKHKLSVGI